MYLCFIMSVGLRGSCWGLLEIIQSCCLSVIFFFFSNLCRLIVFDVFLDLMGDWTRTVWCHVPSWIYATDVLAESLTIVGTHQVGHVLKPPHFQDFEWHNSLVLESTSLQSVAWPINKPMLKSSYPSLTIENSRLPSIEQFAIESGHSEFSHGKWWIFP